MRSPVHVRQVIWQDMHFKLESKLFWKKVAKHGQEVLAESKLLFIVESQDRQLLFKAPLQVLQLGSQALQTNLGSVRSS
jgi:hypothetical protein